MPIKKQPVEIRSFVFINIINTIWNEITNKYNKELVFIKVINNILKEFYTIKVSSL